MKMLTNGLNGCNCWLGSPAHRRLLVELPTWHPSGTVTLNDKLYWGLALHVYLDVYPSS
ncbi:hypothetical protein K439DRAFT_1642805 [Ramaria rubella]|nr:hypothetical protein K439DRAFT_1642805 [Ramaria rubella]